VIKRLLTGFAEERRSYYGLLCAMIKISGGKIEVSNDVLEEMRGCVIRCIKDDYKSVFTIESRKVQDSN
jgi:hypothetical protein